MQNSIPTIYISEIHCCIPKSTNFFNNFRRFVKNYFKNVKLKTRIIHVKSMFGK